ncbi:MAG: bifunctional oligoribonuclease/PAP phosphatase NrnA [Deltaproteobacteria bacterium]|nr:bifunctional oligoribonuclease/PAP phosphatase NrnA [Deltaproteobacteria bacterium]
MVASKGHTPDHPAETMLSLVGRRSAILIMCHNNPDPDTIASAAALKYIFAQKLRRKAVIGYEGTIGRAENRQLVRRLKIDMVRTTKLDFSDFSVIALVDSQPHTGNNAIPRKILPDIVIDHHPLRKDSTRCAFHDVRPSYGSASTILTEYLRELDLTVDPRLATALYYGLKTDTNGLSRSVTKADIDAFNYLFPRIAPRTLAGIENPSVPKSYYLKFADAIARSVQYGDVMISPMGALNTPDVTAEMADFLLRMENIRWTLCMGEYKGFLLLSVRTSRRGVMAGKIALRILKGLGTGGGHEKAAGGKIDLGGVKPEERAQLVGKITDRFLKAVGAQDREGKPLAAAASQINGRDTP